MIEFVFNILFDLEHRFKPKLLLMVRMFSGAVFCRLFDSFENGLKALVEF